MVILGHPLVSEIILRRWYNQLSTGGVFTRCVKHIFNIKQIFL